MSRGFPLLLLTGCFGGLDAAPARKLAPDSGLHAYTGAGEAPDADPTAGTWLDAQPIPLEVPSAGRRGNAGNALFEVVLPPGRPIEALRLSGVLDEVEPATWANEAHLRITDEAGNSAEVRPFEDSDYQGSIEADLEVDLRRAGLVSGVLTLEAFESYDDGGGVDQVWRELALTFRVTDEVEKVLRPPAVEEVRLFFVSGHSPLSDTNREYLCADNELDAMMCEMFEQELGWDCVASCYVDAYGGPGGFQDLHEDWVRYHQENVEPYSNPPRVIVVGHSHGSTWAHNLAFENWADPDLRFAFDYLIDLDAEATGWESSWFGVGDDWRSVIRADRDASWAWDLSNPSGPPDLAQDVPDMTPPAPFPTFNLEVRACPIPFVPEDETPNVRTDGSQDGLAEYDLDRGHVWWEGVRVQQDLYEDLQTTPWAYAPDFGTYGLSGERPWETDDCYGHSAVHEYPAVLEKLMWDHLIPHYTTLIDDAPGQYDD